MLGRTIGRFRVVGKLGEGGMGSVWKAEDTLLGRVVALKFLPESLTSSEAARQRFLREARSTSGLDHPHIATLFEAGEVDGRLFLAVAFVDGETVGDRVARGPLPPREALRVAAEVADALGHAHGRGILHRDVTSRNVMLARDGSAVLIDFGLALRDHTVRLTTTGATFGTLSYMAPETVRGAAATPQSDLYGLGVVLHEMLTGHVPHDGAHRLGLSRSLDRLLVQLLAADPARRPSGATAVAVELRQMRNDAALSAKADGPAPDAAGVAPRTPLPRRTLAVVPFAGAGDGEADAVLADGIADVLCAALSRTPQLRLVPPAVVRGARNFTADPRAAAREFGAGLLLQGSLRSSGTRLRVTFALVDVRRGTQVAAETIEGSADDLFALEDALATAVARALKIEFGARPPGTARPLADGEARHMKYVRALGYLQRQDQQPMVEGAIHLLEELRAEEGGTALVDAALGRAYLILYELNFEPALLDKAEAACRAAVALDPHSPDVQVTLGRLAFMGGRYAESIAALRRALELRPGNPDALHVLARAFEATGRYDEALAIAEEMVALRPDHWTGHNRVAMAHFRSGRSEHAIAPWQRVLELTPDNAVALANLGAAQFQVGRLDEALSCYTRAVAMSPTATASAGAGTVLFFLGRHAEAVSLLERAVRLSPLDARAWGNLADAQRWAEGMELESRASFDHAITLAQEQTRKNPGDAENLARLALWLSKRGRSAEGVAMIRRACALAPAHAGVLGRAVSVHLLAGDDPSARECLALALARGYSWVELLRDPELEPLRKDPETRELLRRTETRRREALARAETTGEEP